MKALNAMLTFNSTIEGIKDAVDRLNSDELLNFNNLLNDMNLEMQSKNNDKFKKCKYSKRYYTNELFKDIQDNFIVEQVLDETMYLGNIIGVENAIDTMVNTVNRGWVQSKYAVDMHSGGTIKRTRFAPEVIFQSEALTTFENKVKQLSGISNPVLGENVFVIVDPNSARSNVRYYIATGEEGDLTPVIEDNQLVSIELEEFADQISDQYNKDDRRKFIICW